MRNRCYAEVAFVCLKNGSVWRFVAEGVLGCESV